MRLPYLSFLLPLSGPSAPVGAGAFLPTSASRGAFRRSPLSASAFDDEDLLTLLRTIRPSGVPRDAWNPPAADTSPAAPATDTLMIDAALGRPVPRTPVWLFRQAGRHLPEYTAYKAERSKNFLELLADPEDVAECTLQPVRRYDVDAAILFSDILVIPEALGLEVTMPGGVGILVPSPLTDPEDAAARVPTVEAGEAKAFVEAKLRHVTDAVRTIRSKMAEEGHTVPLIGFSAAPYTLLYYMVGGSSKKNNDIGMRWLTEHKEESLRLMDTLTTVVVQYLKSQIEAGAQLIQIFEAMGMMIDEPNFYEFAMPCMERIAKELKEAYPEVPVMAFARGASFANSALSHHYDVVTLDGSADRGSARDVVEGRAGLQGNYDPRLLIDDGENTRETVRESVRDMLEAFGPQRLIANLGEGLGGKESTDLVEAFVEAVHGESERAIAEAKI